MSIVKKINAYLNESKRTFDEADFQKKFKEYGKVVMVQKKNDNEYYVAFENVDLADEKDLLEDIFIYHVRIKNNKLDIYTDPVAEDIKLKNLKLVMSKLIKN
jgi:hypothetical protein